MQSFFEECLLLHHQILLILEEALNLPNNELVSLCAEGNGEVRITHYPSIPVAQLKTGSTCRIAEHTDIGILTLLFQDTVGGLEVEDQNHPSLFLPVESKNPGEMILNVGDTLQRWTRNSLLSANHRVTYRQALKDNEVILPPRYSVGFFGKADAAASMKPLAQFLSAEENELMMEGDGRRAQEYYNFMHERTIATTSNL